MRRRVFESNIWFRLGAYQDIRSLIILLLLKSLWMLLLTSFLFCFSEVGVVVGCCCCYFVFMHLPRCICVQNSCCFSVINATSSLLQAWRPVLWVLQSSHTLYAYECVSVCLALPRFERSRAAESAVIRWTQLLFCRSELLPYSLLLARLPFARFFGARKSTGEKESSSLHCHLFIYWNHHNHHNPEKWNYLA